MRIIQVGLGFWGAEWAKVIAQSPHTELAALVDIDEGALKTVGEGVGLSGDKRFTSFTDAIKAVKADAALVVVPPHVHEAVALEVLQAGLHCMIEKPFTTSVATSQNLVDVAASKGLTIMVTQSFRFRRGPRTVKRLIEEGAIGDIEVVYSRFRKDPAFTGFRLEMDEPLIVDVAIHHFDYIRGILGLTPSKVRARSFNPSWSRFAGNASALVEFTTDSGAVVSYTGSWDSRRPHTTWDASWEIQGTRGSLLWDDNKVLLYPYANPIGETVYRIGALERIGDYLEVPLDAVEEEERWGTVREFVTSIRENRQPETSGADNIGSLTMVLAAVESAKSNGQEVDLAEFVSRELGQTPPQGKR